MVVSEVFPRCRKEHMTEAIDLFLASDRQDAIYYSIVLIYSQPPTTEEEIPTAIVRICENVVMIGGNSSRSYGVKNRWQEKQQLSHSLG